MSRTTKIILIVGGLLAVLCLCTAVTGYVVFQKAAEGIQQAFSDNPQEVAAIGAKITDYTLPDGYIEQFGMSMLGMDMIAIGPAKSAGTSPNITVIMLMQVPKNGNYSQEQMEEQMKQSIQQQYGRRGFTITTIETKTITVRGREAIETISEGEDEDGNLFRQITVAFESKNGLGMLMILGEKGQWDETLAENFIRSLR